MNPILEETWNIVFEGKLLPGFDKEVVIKDIEKNFSLSRERLDYIFSGNRVVLKQNIPQSQIEELAQKFKARGLDIELELETAMPVILGETSTIEKDKDDELLDRSQYSTPNIANRHHTRVDKSYIVEQAPDYYNFTVLGRVGRLTFINGTFAYSILFILAIKVTIFNPALYELNKLFPLAIFFPFSLIMIFLIFRLAALRFHDFKFNEWLAILYLFPIISLLTIYFSRLGLFKRTIFVDFGKLIDDNMFYPSLILFAVLFLLLALVPGTKKKNSYGYKVKSGSILAAVVLCSGLILLEYYLKDDLALAQLFEFRIDLSKYRLF